MSSKKYNKWSYDPKYVPAVARKTALAIIFVLVAILALVIVIPKLNIDFANLFVIYLTIAIFLLALFLPLFWVWKETEIVNWIGNVYVMYGDGKFYAINIFSNAFLDLARMSDYKLINSGTSDFAKGIRLMKEDEKRRRYILDAEKMYNTVDSVINRCDLSTIATEIEGIYNIKENKNGLTLQIVTHIEGKRTKANIKIFDSIDGYEQLKEAVYNHKNTFIPKCESCGALTEAGVCKTCGKKI